MIPRADSFCSEVVSTGEVVVVENARADPRFAHLPSVVQGSIASYVGVPLVGRESLRVGAVCVIDDQNRPVDDDQVSRLVEFGAIVEDQLELIRRLHELHQNTPNATAELARAIASGEIVPWYQPITNLSSGRIRCYEALARWVHPSGVVEDPNSFVPFAEDTDLILDLDLVVLRQALEDLSRWQLTDPAIRMSVNLSVRHFETDDWLAPIVAAAVAAGVRPDTVDLELTETSRLAAGVSDGAFVKLLQESGFRVWLDDFGTGWSSLEYLLRLPVDGVKIDRAISVALGTHVGNALTRSVTSLAAELGLSTTIEGIETTDQAQLARALGCDFGQGYLWSKPMPAAQVDLARKNLLPPAVPAGMTRAVDPGTRIERRRAAVTDIRGRHAQGMAVDDGLAVAVLDAIPDATAVLDQIGTILAVNHTWRMFSLDNGGSDKTNGVGVNYLQVCTRAAERGSADAAQVAADLRGVLAGDSFEAEMEYPCPSPALRRWFLLRISRLTGPRPGAVISHVNITRRKMAEDELAHAASHDPLSGLANRTLLVNRLTAALSTRSGHRMTPDIAVLYIDLDGFKPVNDTYGHAAGDEVLMGVAGRLQGAVRAQDTVGRLGGDEFGVIAPGIDRDGLTALAQRVREALAEPHWVHGQPLVVPGSIGTYLASAGEDSAKVLRRADAAMYVEKQARHTA